MGIAVEKYTRLVLINHIFILVVPLDKRQIRVGSRRDLAVNHHYMGAMFFPVATAGVEETDNLRKFSDEYADYMKITRIFIPFLF